MKENKFLHWVRGKKKASWKTSLENEASLGMTSENCQKIVLVRGMFTPLEAADVLLTLVNDKIKFHTIQSLNLNEGQEEDAVRSERRIVELKEAKGRIEELVIKARNEGFEVEIDSLIDIKLRKPTQHKTN